MVVPVLVVFCITASISSFVIHDHPHRKVFVGSVALVASAAMYGSPLVAMVGSLLLCFAYHIHLALQKKSMLCNKPRR